MPKGVYDRKRPLPMTDFTRPKTGREIESQKMDEWGTRDLAEYFGVSRETIGNWIRAGKLKAEDVTLTGKSSRVGKWVVRSEELQRIHRRGLELLQQKEARKYFVRLVWRDKEGKPL